MNKPIGDSGFPSFDRDSVAIEPVFSNQISITSAAGVGSSTTLRILQRILGNPYRFVSAGGLMRLKAKQLGMTIEEFASHNARNLKDGYDYELDSMIADFAKHNYLVVEGRLPHAFMPRSFRCLLKCRLDIRAGRRHVDFPEKSLAEVTAKMIQRDDDDTSRYEELYPGSIWPEEHFDFVDDTGIHGPEEIAENMLAAHASWLIGRQCEIGVQFSPSKMIVTE